MMDLNKVIARQSKKPSSVEEDPKATEDVTSEEADGPVIDEHSTEKEKANAARPLKDWGGELEKRIEAEKNKDPSRAKSEGKVKEEFWIEFFNSRWEPKVAEKLIQMRLLQQDIEELGFDPLLNPILAFLIRPFAKKIVKDGLLNEVTYRGLHNAVAHRYLADSELVQENSYNIIYCRDLYTKPSKDIESYLSWQKLTLSPSASAYNEKTRSRNVQIFMENGNTSVDGGKLRPLDEIKELVEKLTGQTAAGPTEDKVEVKQVKLNDIIKEMKNRLQLIATLQYVSMSTNSLKAHEALQAINMSNINMADLAKATQIISGKLKNVHLTKDSVESFVKAIQARLKEVDS